MLGLWRESNATASATDNAVAVRAAIQHSSALVLVAESDGDIVGSIIGGFDGWRGNVYRLVVHPERRRQGIARRLVSGVDDWLADLGVRRVNALAEKAHPLARPFWDASGYELDERMTRYVRDLPR